MGTQVFPARETTLINLGKTVLQLSLDQLTPDSVLADLPAHKFQASLHTPGQLIIQTFRDRPELPGVVVIDDFGTMVGVISRRIFFEQISKPFGLEIYSRRPIQIFLKTLKIEPLELSSNHPIGQAAAIALSRPSNLLFEPVVIVQQGQQPCLVDVQVLLLAQSQILALVNTLVQQQKQEMRLYVERLQREQGKVKEYTRLLEAKQLESQRRNRLLEAQRDQLSKQAQQISELNQRFVHIGRLLTLEGRETFQATFTAVDAICQSMDNIVLSGHAFVRELEAVDKATGLIEQVSKQVRYLATRTAVVMNQSGGSISTFSHLTTEIANLGRQISEAGEQVHQISTRFKARIKDLAKVAREGESIARSLDQKSRQTEKTLAELEKLVSEQGKPELQPVPSKTA